MLPIITKSQGPLTFPPKSKTTSSDNFKAALQEAAKKTERSLVTQAELRDLMEKAFEAFQREFDAFMHDPEDQKNKIVLRVGPDGRTYVEGNHEEEEPEEGETESEEDRQDARSLLEKVQALKESPAFQAAYRKDPKGAIARFARLFDQTNETVTGLVLDTLEKESE